ncbi:unnamed protein product, partial [marine sediment metagenome]
TAKNKDLKIEILDARKSEETVIHSAKVLSGVIKPGQQVEAEIDAARRGRIACNHTATHLLQAALRKVLGAHVRQSGSWVGPDKLRFDFTHFQVLNQRQLARVEELVNREIRQNKKLNVLNTTFEESQKMGALALFGEKYQEKVRVVKIADTSLELCGGTHVSSTAEIGMFKIISESSVASGIRRVEALTGERARAVLKEKASRIKGLIRDFGGTQEQLPQRLEKFLRRIKKLNQRLDNTRMKDFKSAIDGIVTGASEISG